MATLNNDGVSVRGCQYIYAPRGQAGEYSALAANPYRGCGHACRYCYVPNVLRMSREEFNHGAVPREGFIEKLTRDAEKYQELGVREQVMLSFTTDPYHTGDVRLTRETLKVLIDHGLGVCTLTKGGTRACRDMDLFRHGRDAFACTLTSLDRAFQKRWEPNAAEPLNRVEALRRFHENGIYTWVSLEPTLDVDASIAIVRETHHIVDLFKVGRVNYTGLTKTIDWEAYTLRMIEVLAEVGAAHYIKHDLQPYLPDGYHNPLRVDQFHREAVTA